MIWSSICNSDLVVPSPVEDYFLYIDDLAYPEKVRTHALVFQSNNFLCNINFWCHFLSHSWQKEAERITQPYLDALGDDYSVCCQGIIYMGRICFFILLFKY